MKIYFTLKNIPELHGLDRHTRGRAWRACVSKTFRHWQTWFAFCAPAAPVAIYILSLCLLPINYEKLFLTHYLAFRLSGLFVGILCGPAFFLFYSVQVEVIRPYLREYLKKNLISCGND